MNNDILYILSEEGSLEFKHQLANAENMARLSSSISNLEEAHNELYYNKLHLIDTELRNPAYSKNQRETMKIYRDKLNNVIRLLQRRLDTLMSYDPNASGGRKKTRRRKSIRRKSIRRKSIRRKSIRRKRY